MDQIRRLNKLIIVNISGNIHTTDEEILDLIRNNNDLTIIAY